MLGNRINITQKYEQEFIGHLKMNVNFTLWLDRLYMFQEHLRTGG